MKHTPGPWKVEYTDTHSQFKDAKGKYNYGTQAVLVVARDCVIHPVADTSANHTCRDQIECEANARLIAAAPDLLEALDALLKAHDALFAAKPGEDKGKYCDAIDDAEAAASAAIKKARGE